MGEIRPEVEVLPIIAAFSRHAEALDAARDYIQNTWGGVALVSPDYSFQETDYYEAAMGRDLIKRFYAVDHLADPAQLADWKLQSNRWEAAYAKMAAVEESRPLNIDPGYLTLAKLVLATTKDHAHRIYLRDGIYAEVTLSYHQRRWRSHPWTFPDFRREDYHSFLSQCRDYLRSLTRGAKLRDEPPRGEEGSR